MVIGRMTEDVIGLLHLVEGELADHELVDGQFLLGNEGEEHRQRADENETHRDVDDLDPQLVERDVDGPTVDASGKPAMIGSLADAADLLKGNRGTVVTS
jgi:hypothetical protein